jgi:hypothetical protein
MLPAPPDESPQCVRLNTDATKPANLIHPFAMRMRLKKPRPHDKRRETKEAHSRGPGDPSNALSVNNQSSAKTFLISNCLLSAPSDLEMASVARNVEIFFLPLACVRALMLAIAVPCGEFLRQ